MIFQDDSVGPELFVLLFMSIIAALCLRYIILAAIPMFLASTKVRMYGIDQCKRGQIKVAESQGLIGGCVYLIVMFLFIMVPFKFFQTEPSFPYIKFIHYLAGLLTICCMMLLGFVDDVLDLRWRHKLTLPTLASLPLLLVYYATGHVTTVAVPLQLRAWLGDTLDIGPLYYVYMAALTVFCTNAINIYAGVNGIEIGQSALISASIIVFNCVEMARTLSTAPLAALSAPPPPLSNSSSLPAIPIQYSTTFQGHLISLYFMIPFCAVASSMLTLNWYPARIFPGDTFCYFAGMTFASVGILGRFSKTLLLFFLPQIANFVISTPQVFRLVPCPRHRLPRLDERSGLLCASTARFRVSSLSLLGRLVLCVFRALRLVRVIQTNTHANSESENENANTKTKVKKEDEKEKKEEEKKEMKEESEEMVEMTNMTLICVALNVCGPQHEAMLTTKLLCLQVLCGGLALAIRYPIADFFYEP